MFALPLFCYCRGENLEMLSCWIVWGTVFFSGFLLCLVNDTAAYVQPLHMNGSHYGQKWTKCIFSPLVLCWDRVHYGGYSISVLGQ